MGTRSKKFNPPSPAMSTRSKRMLSLWFHVWSPNVMVAFGSPFLLIMWCMCEFDILWYIWTTTDVCRNMDVSGSCCDAFCIHIYELWDVSKNRGGSVQIFNFLNPNRRTIFLLKLVRWPNYGSINWSFYQEPVSNITVAIVYRGKKVFSCLSLTPLVQKMH